MGFCSVVVFVSFLLVLVLSRCLFHQVSAQKSHLLRDRRTLYFPPYDAVAIGAALAIPLDNGRGNVFVSYCMESNYVHPTYSIEEVALDPPPFTPPLNGETVEDRQLDAEVEDLPSTTSMPSNEENNETLRVISDSTERKNIKRQSTASKNPLGKRRMRNSFISRKKFYQMVENKMLQHGLNGKKCLQRAICDANLFELGALNGVLGDFVHIMFSPSTSKDENLPKKYYVAEQRGRNGESCEKAYGKECPNGIFDLITTIK